jgi:hypothetical protein
MIKEENHMKSKSSAKKLVSTLLALALVCGLCVIMPLTASAEDGPFQVTEHPVGATYLLNAAAVPLSATFKFQAVVDGYIDDNTPIKVGWYWSYDNSTTDRSNPFGESTVVYDRDIVYTTTHTPATDTVGVKYYYAVISYAESITVTSGQSTSEPRETVCDPARIEVTDSDDTKPVTQDFRVKKVDEEGKPLAGAVISLVPDSGIAQEDSVKPQEATSKEDGFASFSAGEGYYILSEKQAPQGYNATDDKYYIWITANGVYTYDPDTRTANTRPTEEYETVTFVNKKIPSLNKEDHFAFMQGYPPGDFRPERNMTRAEAVVMFSRLLSKSMDMNVNYRNSYYPDVNGSAWYANQVCHMQTLGVLADYSRDGNFRPDDPVTRAEFATLAAHFDNLALATTNSFSDVPDSHWAVKYINSAAAKGWVTGYPGGTFKPEANITRAEVVTLVGRMLDRAADSAYLTANAKTLPRIYTDLASGYWAYLAIMEASTGHDYTKDSMGEHWTAVYK